MPALPQPLTNLYSNQVTQEVVLASTVFVSLGSEIMSLSHLVHLLGDYAYDWNSKHVHFSQFAFRDRAAYELRSQSMLFLLSYFRNKECSIQRDRVFSLLSLCHEGHRIEVDYKARRVDLAARILKLNPETVCVCSATIVASSLGLHADGGGIPDPSRNPNQHWLDIHFSVEVARRDNEDDPYTLEYNLMWKPSPGPTDSPHFEHDLPRLSCSRGVLETVRWFLRDYKRTRRWLTRNLQNQHIIPLSSALRAIGWDKKRWYSLGPAAPGHEMSVYDADRNICVIRVALWALNPGATTLGYPDLCSSPRPDQNVDSPIKKIEVVYATENEISGSIVNVLEA
jgi:hypothetical protein